MERRLKQRLVGAVVLVSLVVIFVPMLLEEEPIPRSGIRDTNIPPRPPQMDEFSSRVLPLPDEDLGPEREAPEPTSAPAPVTEPVAGEPAGGPDAPEPEIPAPTEPAQQAAARGAPTKPASDASPAPQGDAGEAKRPRVGISAWAVQVGSFAKAENARELVERLRGAELDAFTEEAEIGGKTWHRVRVGPELDRREAEAMQERVSEVLGEAGENAKIVRHP